MGSIVRGHSLGQRIALAFAALAAWVIACSSASSPVGSGAGTDGGSGGDGTGQDSGSEASADGASDGPPEKCTNNGYDCNALTVCCAGGTCTAGPNGGSTCIGGDSGVAGCLTKGQPCSSIECCNGQSNCGEGTINICP